MDLIEKYTPWGHITLIPTYRLRIKSTTVDIAKRKGRPSQKYGIEIDHTED